MTSLESFGAATWPHAGKPAAHPWLGGALRKAAWSVGKVVALVALTGLALGSASLMVESSGAGDRERIPSTSWVEVNRPIQLYGLAGTEFTRLPLVYRARRHVTGGGREDILTFGDLQGSEPYLRLSLYRTGSEAVTPPSFAADLDRLGRESGLGLTRMDVPTAIATRFGTFEAADLRLVENRIPTPCLGFRNTPVESAILRISGFICGAADRPIGRDSLGCVIDRVDLESAGEDTALQDLFVEAERRRGPDCAPSPLTAAGAKTTWLDANASLPPLKGPLKQVATKR